MNLNAKWSQWIIASIYKYLKDGLSGTTVLVPGEDQPQPTTSWVKVEVSGPIINEQSRNDFELEIMVSVYVQTKVKTNFYDHQTLSGQVAALLGTHIPVLKLGAAAGDDASKICCLTPYTSVQRALNINDNGFVKYDISLQQTVIRAYYITELTGGS